MKRHWYVVANSARARVLEHADGDSEWADVVDLVHPQSRWLSAKLADDRPGHGVGRSPGGGGSAYGPRTDPRQRERERFARELAHLLDAGIASGRCDDVVLVASQPFLGVLGQHLTPGVGRRVRATAPHDWTRLGDAMLVARLKDLTHPALATGH